MKINWIGGDLPKIGKSWLVRGLSESIFNKYQTPPIVVDTSIDPKLSKIYNPNLLDYYTPNLYFSENSIRADEIYNLSEQYENLVVKLSSTSQSRFLKWLEDTDMLNSDVEQHFWFVTNSHRDSSKYFTDLYQFLESYLGNRNKCRISLVRNCYNLKWQDYQEITNVDICSLSGIITNQKEIQYIEDNGLILSEIARAGNSTIPVLFRSRLIRFLDECSSNLLAEKSPEAIQEEVEPELYASESLISFNEVDDDDDEIQN